MVTTRPPTAIVPFRGVPSGLAATWYSTVPFPVPVAPPVIEIQEASAVAVHAQPFCAVM
jgi:hypothetical protein